MRAWSPARVACAAGATLLSAPEGVEGGPAGVSIDTRTLRREELFVGLAGAHADGGRFAAQALAGGAWGVLVGSEHARGLPAGAGVVLGTRSPLAALGALARAWRRQLGARVVAITGSTGKTSTKQILAALLAPALATVASAANRNTEIGLPLAILDAPAGTEALVLELAMRGAGQIAELAAICEPDVAVIVNVGPAHLELLGSLEAIAAAKAELIDALAPGATAIVPAREPLLEPHLRQDVRVRRFGEGGDVAPAGVGPDGVAFAAGDRRIVLEPAFRAPHLLEDLCAALAAALALGVVPAGPIEVAFPPLHGERIALPGGIVVVNDCYNANPMSMRAALDELAATATARRVAVLGDMLELGAADERRYHRDLGERAAAAGVALLVTVGPRAAWAGEAFAGEHVHAADAAAAASLLGARLEPGDTVLVKGSRGVGLERIATALAER